MLSGAAGEEVGAFDVGVLLNYDDRWRRIGRGRIDRGDDGIIGEGKVGSARRDGVP